MPGNLINIEKKLGANEHKHGIYFLVPGRMRGEHTTLNPHVSLTDKDVNEFVRCNLLQV